MDEAVARLASDSGALRRVTAEALPGGRYRSLTLHFDNGGLNLRCTTETDEIVASVGATAPSADEIFDAPELTGLEIEYAWTMENHRGYADAFQIRLYQQGRTETRQFEVAGAAIEISVVPPSAAR